MTRRLGIVLVNWNRWADTIECLESVLRAGTKVHIVVVDNASADGSLDRIAEWAAGGLPAQPADPDMARFSQPPVAKPIKVIRLDAATAAATPPADVDVTLIDSGGNLGFAGGNNVGLRHLLLDPRVDYFWLLNNDTVIDPRAPAALIQRLDATHRVGMCGTMVRYYHRPTHIQALGGSVFSMWTGQSRGLGFNQPASMPFDPALIARQTDFVLGASLAVSRGFLETVGLMEESYFLYFEEIDWAVRGRGRFVTAFAHAAVVYHKEGGSIGSSGTAGGRSAMSEYYMLRARHGFIKRHRPWLLPVHGALSLALIARRLLRGNRVQAAAMLRALTGRPY
ncbi:glycosyltransferase family 2 protein [Glacieibacterium frigidum]|uniref:glycosyltransferase family 2 protein n=1 Tax=Glacieibacterium frigidum TaxID=2593303 RepID=UPI00163DCD99|nr:glycosyltransferase family 2 protein [Glacieibacterium frigidum]